MSEDFKHPWNTIIAALISVVTTNEIKLVIIYISSTFFPNDLLRSKRIAATRHDEGLDFEARVASSYLLAIDFSF